MSLDFLEDFGAPPPAPAAADPVPVIDPMQGYETGYQAGWDDALVSVETERGHISAEFARNLQELSFSFHEARAQATASLKPFVAAMLHALLPMTASQSLIENVWSAMEPVLQDHNAPTVNLMCAAEDTELLEEFAAKCSTMEIIVIAEPSLIQGQAKFQIAAERHELDVSAIVAQITSLISADIQPYLSSDMKGMKHAG